MLARQNASSSAAGVDHGRLAALEAAGEQRGDEQERDEKFVPGYVACVVHSSDFVIAGLDPAIHQKQGIS